MLPSFSCGPFISHSISRGAIKITFYISYFRTHPQPSFYSSDWLSLPPQISSIISCSKPLVATTHVLSVYFSTWVTPTHPLRYFDCVPTSIYGPLFLYIYVATTTKCQSGGGLIVMPYRLIVGTTHCPIITLSR